MVGKVRRTDRRPGWKTWSSLIAYTWLPGAPHAALALLEAGADLDVFGEAGQDWAAFRADTGSYDHAVGFDAAELARGEVHNHDDSATDERFRLVILGDPGADLADFGANVDGELEKLIGADDAFGGFHLAYPHFDFRKILDGYF